MLLAAALALCAAASNGSAGAEPPPPPLVFTAGELARIKAHGPWPPPPARDPGNALAGQPSAVALGQQLFFDTRLSVDGRLSCASCHAPQLAFADGLPRSLGRVQLDRNAPSLWNAGHQRWLGWDGASDSLWSQALRPLLDPRELASSASHVQALLARDSDLACRYRRSGADPASRNAEALLVHTAKALAAFVATLTSERTAFDEFRDALLRGDTLVASRYAPDAQRGLRLFVGRGQCFNCHSGPGFSHGEFADIGVPHFVRSGVVDTGRHGGIEALREGRYNLLSRWRDPTAPDDSIKTRHVRQQPSDFGAFKVPGLRNVAHTAPYMHAGTLASLDDVIRHYAELDLDRVHAEGETLLRPLRLNAGESADLQAFLRSLSGTGARQWRAPALPACPGRGG